MKILKFYTETCMPCKLVGKMLDKMDVEVEAINAIEDIAKVDEYNVCTTPTLIFLNEEGTEVDRLSGIVTEAQIKNILNK